MYCSFDRTLFQFLEQSQPYLPVFAPFGKWLTFGCFGLNCDLPARLAMSLSAKSGSPWQLPAHRITFGPSFPIQRQNLPHSPKPQPNPPAARVLAHWR
jgi:hypothetical protein